MFLKKKDNKNEAIVVKDIKTLPKMKKLRLAEYRKKVLLMAGKTIIILMFVLLIIYPF